MYSETCLNRRPCSKAKTLLRRQASFILSVFYVLCFHAFLKQKRGHCIRWTTFYQSSDKKAPYHTRTQIKILGISKMKRIKFAISVNFLKKKYFFYTLKQHNFFLILIWSFERVEHFWFELCIFYSKLLSATN